MKSAVMTAADVAIGNGADRSTLGFVARVKNTLEALRQSHAERAMRAELAGLDDHVLRDLGIAPDEMSRVRSGQDFTPRAWRD